MGGGYSDTVKTKFAVGYVLFCLMANGAQAQSTNAAGTLVLSLEHCLELALGGNLSLALGRQEPQRRGEDFYIAGETFAPTVFADAEYNNRESRTENSQQGAEILEQKSGMLNVGLRKTWTLGTRADLAWASARREDNSEFRLLNPSFSAHPTLQLTQPLLRGFGLAVNRAELDRALLDKDVADSDFAILLESELLATYRAYWELVRAAAHLTLEETSLRLAADQVDIVSNRLDVGAAAPLDLTSAEVALARQREAVIGAANGYRKAGDALLFRIRPSGRLEDYDLAIIPSTEATAPDATQAVPSLRDSVDVSLGQRPELHRGDQRVARADIDVAGARNGRQPDLSVFGRYGYDGLADDYGDAVNEVSDRTYPEWTAGLSLEFLFDNESRRARWRQAVLGKESAELERQQALAEIVLEVRAATFDLEAAFQTVVATQRTHELARAQYEGELERLRVGSSTVFQVDTFRRDQLAADRNQLDARINTFVARAVLEVARGEFARNILGAVQGAGGE